MSPIQELVVAVVVQINQGQYCRSLANQSVVVEMQEDHQLCLIMLMKGTANTGGGGGGGGPGGQFSRATGGAGGSG